ncbi:gas vesicle protein GvpM [Natrarchaeobius oligotrophus]|uniref:Gas vesicle protein n=1 Tax=Natrarchaeobius chitinivorans TaxID=1679083 RepID=A0A3N6MM45_NATCH|nr:gas vesicle protein [Natrarchaeobius chitinivorans]RQG98450.1 gas vesicle protein [Natrarchaeobius chitinivorans]
MRPRKDDEALVDVLDVLLRDGAVLRADVIVSVADVPLVGIKLTAAIAGMETMTDYGLFEQWDVDRRRSAITRRQYGRRNDGE